MWQRHAERLSEEIKAVLSPVPREGRFYKIVGRSLAVRLGDLTDTTKRHKPWPVLPLVVCEAVSGYFEPALPAAAALLLFSAAADVFDDVEDDDKSISSRAGGRAAANNSATALLILAEQSLLRLRESGAGSAATVKVAAIANSYYLQSCLGQHLDLVYPEKKAITEEDYLHMIQMKTGSHVECACVVGAILGGSKKKINSAFGKFGRNLGMAAQIANDIQGMLSGDDIEKRKVTIAGAFAGAGRNGAPAAQASRKTKMESDEAARFKRHLLDSGGVFYAAVKMEEYRQTAADTLLALEKTGLNVSRLRGFVEDGS